MGPSWEEDFPEEGGDSEFPYQADFLGFSYVSRPGRSPHLALRTPCQHLSPPLPDHPPKADVDRLNRVLFNRLTRGALFERFMDIRVA
jgi:hypothetical protein